MKKSKTAKISALILALALIVMMAVPAFAAKTVKVKVEAGGSDGKLYVRLTAPADSDIASMSAPLYFDTAKLDYSNVSYIESGNIVSVTGDERTDEGIVLASTVFSTSLTKESKIFTYEFDVKDGAEGDVDFTFGDIVAKDSNGDPINISIDGETTASLDSLEPLSPDAIDDFGGDTDDETTTFPEDEPVEGITDNASDSSSDSGSSTTDGSNYVPNTSRRIIAASVFGAVAAGAAAAAGIVIVRKKKSED
ncbi:MAG: hypothetical protein K5761_04730 [Clostridiales bacterium]|nr:hypothetical protein [Clostridiales bacterium]